MRWVIVFLIATIGSGLLGFGATSPIAGSIGQFLFGISLIMFLVALMVRAMQKGALFRLGVTRVLQEITGEAMERPASFFKRMFGA